MRSKILKRMTAILIVFLMSINSFAAVVSDNDGSAFITKAEFDSLKNNFQSQIDQYNQSIDSKIDGAIAAYLAGLTVQSWKTNNIITNTWKNVTCMNKAQKPTFVFPTANINLMWATGYMRWNDGTNLDIFADENIEYSTVQSNGRWTTDRLRFFCDIVGVLHAKYDQPSNEYGTRPLATIKTNSDGTERLIWGGIATNYRESFNLVRDNIANRLFSYFDNPTGFNKIFYIYNISQFSWDGKFTDWSSSDESKSGWPIVYKSHIVTGAPHEATIFSTAMTTFDNKSTSVVLDTDASGNTTTMDHVLNWDDSTAWSLYAVDHLNSFRQHSENPCKGSTFLNKFTLTKQGFASQGSAHTLNPDGVVTNWSALNMVLEYRTSEDAIISSVGMLQDDKLPSEILQDDVTENLKFDNQTRQRTPKNLLAGLPLLFATNETQIKWSPIFDLTVATDASGHKYTNNHEVDIYFSYVPFSDGYTTTDPVVLDGGSTFITTSSRTANINWKMTKDAIVYVKFRPHLTSDDAYNREWQARLDLENSNQWQFMDVM